MKDKVLTFHGGSLSANFSEMAIFSEGLGWDIEGSLKSSETLEISNLFLFVDDKERIQKFKVFFLVLNYKIQGIKFTYKCLIWGSLIPTF